MKKLSFVIISFILLLNLTLNAQSKKYNIILAAEGGGDI